MSTSKVWKLEGGEEWLGLDEELRRAVWEEMLKASAKWGVSEVGSYVLRAWEGIREQAKEGGGWVDREMIRRVCEAIAVVSKRTLGPTSIPSQGALLLEERRRRQVMWESVAKGKMKDEAIRMWEEGYVDGEKNVGYWI